MASFSQHLNEGLKMYPPTPKRGKVKTGSKQVNYREKIKQLFVEKGKLFSGY